MTCIRFRRFRSLIVLSFIENNFVYMNTVLMAQDGTCKRHEHCTMFYYYCVWLHLADVRTDGWMYSGNLICPQFQGSGINCAKSALFSVSHNF